MLLIGSDLTRNARISKQGLPEAMSTQFEHSLPEVTAYRRDHHYRWVYINAFKDKMVERVGKSTPLSS